MSRLLRAALCALALTLAAHAQTPIPSAPTHHDKRAAKKEADDKREMDRLKKAHSR